MRQGSLKQKSLEIFEGLARYYDLTLDLATIYQDRRWKDWVIRRMGRAPNGFVLDVGCGTLVLEGRMAKSGVRFLGLDLSSEMLRIAHAKGAPNVALLTNADAEYLPFADACFDSVVSCYVPKYVDPEKFSRELARVTRPGGEVLLYDFARPSGAASPFLRAYIDGGLPVFGRALGLAGRSEARTFRDLPRIIEGTRWDVELPLAMERQGFDMVEAARMTWGTVFACRGKRR